MFKKIDDYVEEVYYDVSSVYYFLNSHTISQREYSSTFNNNYGDVDKGDVSSGYGSMKIHNYIQQNYL